MPTPTLQAPTIKPDDYAATIDDIGRQITEVFARYKWLGGTDAEDLIAAKNHLNRVKSRLMVKG